MRRLLNEFSESARMASDQLAAHKGRSLLTALGVIIGVWAVILIGMAITGIDRGFQQSIDMLGSDVFYVQKYPWRDIRDEWYLYRNRENMQAAYADELNRIFRETPNSRLALAVPLVRNPRTIQRDDRGISSVQVYGTNADWPELGMAEFAYGRFFTENEAAGGQNIIVLGYDVAEALFPEGQDRAIGQQVLMAERRFTVIGVLERTGSFLGMQSFDQVALLPLPSFMRFFEEGFRRGDPTEIRVRMAEGADLEWARDELTGAMRRVRHLMPGEENDFEINHSEAVEATLGPVKQGIAIAGFLITGLSLFVGAIGIMNITFVSVKERTREIGTLRAIGARRFSILLQFLTEAVSVCLLGGMVGLVLAIITRYVVGFVVPNFPVILSPTLIVLAVAISVLTGVVSGFAPAWQASRLDPATALRHE